MEEIKCKQCKEIFRGYKSQNRKFCSRFCVKKFYKIYGRPRNTGRTRFKKGLIPWNVGKRYEIKKQSVSIGRRYSPSTEIKEGQHLSQKTEFKKGMIPWNKGKASLLTMEKHPNWKGGISFEPYGVEFDNTLKEQIRKRDNYRCQECFRHQDELYTKTGKKYKLNIHHIDYNKKNNSESNLISLCRSCHLQTNFQRKDWTNYFQNKL